MKMKMPQAHSSHDPRIRHAGKAGKHHTRVLDIRKGNRRRPKRQPPRHLKWRETN